MELIDRGFKAMWTGKYARISWIEATWSRVEPVHLGEKNCGSEK